MSERDGVKVYKKTIQRTLRTDLNIAAISDLFEDPNVSISTNSTVSIHYNDLHLNTVQLVQKSETARP